MKKPRKPIHPIEPKASWESYDELWLKNIDDNEKISLTELQKMQEQHPNSEIFIVSEFDNYSYDPILNVQIVARTIKTIPNSNYDKAMAKYQKKLQKYEGAMAQYEKDLKAWKQWNKEKISQEKSKAKAQQLEEAKKLLESSGFKVVT